MLPRVIPLLLIKEERLYKGQKFTKDVYVGDPINTIRIFNEKEVDEIIVLDIAATMDGGKPDLEYIRQMASECFMPLCYGGGITTLDEIESILRAGIEKVSLNAICFERPEIVTEAAERFGSQAVVASIDVRKKMLGQWEVRSHRAERGTQVDPVTHARKMEDLGAGEILLTSVIREGMCEGYDLDLVKAVSEAVSIPVIASGGGGSLDDFSAALKAGASAVSAGSFFVFYGKHRAVLITYPDREELKLAFGEI